MNGINVIENLKFVVDPVEIANVVDECGPLGYREFIEEDVVGRIYDVIGDVDVEVNVVDVDEVTGVVTYNIYQ